MQRLIEDLYDMAKKQKTPELIRQREKHPSPLKRSYEVHGLLPDGIILQIYQQFQIPSAIRIIINPSTFTSGSYIPEALYHPKEYPGVLQKVVSLLDETFSNTQLLETGPSAFEFKPRRSHMEPLSPPRNRGNGSDPTVQTKQ